MFNQTSAFKLDEVKTMFVLRSHNIQRFKLMNHSEDRLGRYTHEHTVRLLSCGCVTPPNKAAARHEEHLCSITAAKVTSILLNSHLLRCVHV